MKKNRYKYIKNNFLPLLMFSLVTGIFTGTIIFLFKIVSGAVIALSGEIFGFVRANPTFIPLLVAGAAVIGFLASLILNVAPDCRGGGIPSAIAALRGQVPMRRIISLPFVFLSSLLTYICGVPLGSEGPSVQMGTLVGWLVSKTIGKRDRAWHRFIMTGGACAGFAAATGAPLTGIFFAFEEAHRRFTPMIFMSASLTVVISSVTMEILCSLAGVSPNLFGFTVSTVMSVEYMWSALLIGLTCGVIAIFFTKAYSAVRNLLTRYTQKIPFALRIVIIFVAVSLVGVISTDCIGTGHHTIEELMAGHGIWYILIAVFLIRAVFLMISNTQGITGGLFIPTLAFGAIIGSVCGKGMVSLGILPEEYYIITVIIGMTSFLAASSRVPITALAFSMEALSGITNFLPIAIGVAVSFSVIEIAGIKSFNDTVVDMKIEEHNKGREILVNDVELIVKKGAFVIGHEVRDILWPPSCIIISIIKNPETKPHSTLGEGDLLSVHYSTAYPEYTAERLEELVGQQDTI